MRVLEEIIVHCSATPPRMDIGAEWIRDLHVNQNGWADIGYHFVIRRNGDIEEGRPLWRTGAHTSGNNQFSIGICMIGGVDDTNQPEKNFTDEQWSSLYNLVSDLKEQYNIQAVNGHNQYANKACPSFDVQDWRQTVGI